MDKNEKISNPSSSFISNVKSNFMPGNYNSMAFDGPLKSVEAIISVSEQIKNFISSEFSKIKK